MKFEVELVNATSYLPAQDINGVFSEGQSAQNFNSTYGIRGFSVTHLAGSRLRERPNSGEKYIGGGGLAETLRDQIPLERSCGIQSTLYLPRAQRTFYSICQRIFGHIIDETEHSLSLKEHEEYLGTCAALAAPWKEVLEKEQTNIVVIHDFEFLPLVSCVPRSTIKVLHWHVDFPIDPEAAIPYLLPYLNEFDVAIAADRETASKLSRVLKSTSVIAPSINPTAEKLATIPPSEAGRILDTLGVNPDKPIIAQVGRISSQKDPVSAVKVFERVQKNFPDAQLILAGLYNLPGRDFTQTLQELEDSAKGNQGIHLFVSPEAIAPHTNEEFLCAIYQASDVVINMGQREGFGLGMTEAMWRKNIVVAIDSPGARTQIESGSNGFITENVAEASQKVLEVLKKPEYFYAIKECAHQSVRDKLLISRYMKEVLQLYRELLQR